MYSLFIHLKKCFLLYSKFETALDMLRNVTQIYNNVMSFEKS
jgi:hypothetical protein